MKQYKIELYTKPVFDDQYRFRVHQVNYGESAKDYKETPIMTGLDTLANFQKELKYWLNNKLNNKE